MPRTIPDANLGTRTARVKLAVQHKPHYRLIEPGFHLGYRKLGNDRPGTWVARRYDGKGGYAVANLRTPDNALVIADDYEDADGVRVLSFAQAQQKARGARKTKSGPLTVSVALDEYLQFLDGQGRSRHAIDSTRYRIEASIRPQLGKISVGALTAERLRHWRDEMAKTPARMRTGKGHEQKFRDVPDDEARRKRRVSANRIWNILRAALNHAFHDGKVETDVAWRKVKPFNNVDVARTRYLAIAEAKRLINACDPEFRPLVQAALQTGARYGELARLQVRDFNVDAGTVAVRQSKSGKPRHIVLTDEGVALFKELTAGKSNDELIVHKANGGAWGPSEQWRFMGGAVKRAKITPSISFHGLRHTWASLSVMGGMPLMVVARNLGHSDTRMVEKHYGHLAPSFVTETIRKHAPSFGFKPDRKVVELG